MISNLINLYYLQEATEASFENIAHLIREHFGSECGFCEEFCKCETIESFYVKLGDSGILYVCLEVRGSFFGKNIKNISLYGFVAHTYVDAGDWYYKDYLYIMSDLDEIFDLKIPTNIFPAKYISYNFGNVFLTHIPIVQKHFHMDSGLVS